MIHLLVFLLKLVLLFVLALWTFLLVVIVLRLVWEVYTVLWTYIKAKIR